MIQADTMHYGPFNARRFVTANDGETVTYMLPISQETRTCSVEEFEAWMAQADQPTPLSED